MVFPLCMREAVVKLHGSEKSKGDFARRRDLPQPRKKSGMKMATESSKLAPLLQEFAEALELEMPIFDEKKRTVQMAISPVHTIDFHELPKGVSMSARIGECPPKNKEDFYLLLMRANFLGQGTGKSVIGMDQEEKYLTLSSFIPYEMDFKKFKETVEDFVNFVDYWKDELARHIAQADATLIS